MASDQASPEKKKKTAPSSYLSRQLRISATSPNTLAAVVYLGYCILCVYIDAYAQPRVDEDFTSLLSGPVAQIPLLNPVDDPTTNADDDYKNWYSAYVAAVQASPYLPDLETVNTLWKVSALWHLFNALQYYSVWYLYVDPVTGKRPFPYLLPVIYQLFPEVMNVVEAVLYTATAFLYPQEAAYGPQSYIDPASVVIHKVELAASVIELFAAFLWVYVWWRAFPRSRGRGVTLDDPEFTALVLLVLSSFIYLAYNVIVLRDPILYGDPDTSKIYTAGDWLYLVGTFQPHQSHHTALPPTDPISSPFPGVNRVPHALTLLTTHRRHLLHDRRAARRRVVFVLLHLWRVRRAPRRQARARGRRGRGSSGGGGAASRGEGARRAEGCAGARAARDSCSAGLVISAIR